MKKLLKTIILLILVIPFVVKADMGMPVMKEYEVEVIKDEINYYDYNGEPKGTIPKGTTINIIYGYNIDNEEYLFGEYGKEWVYIKSKDVVTKDEFGIDAEGVGQYLRQKIKSEKELEVKKGPSESFETVGTLKAGEYEFEYATQTPLYVYVDTKDVKGWVKAEDNDLLFGGLSYIVPVEKETKCGTIPANYELKEIWKKVLFESAITVKYNDCETELSTFTDVVMILLQKKVYKTKKEIELYNNIGNQKEKAEKTIPEGKEYVLLSDQFTKNQFTKNAEFYYYIEYNKKHYWIVANDLILESEFVKDYVEPKEKKDKEEDEEKEDKIDTKTIIIICVTAGISLALGALITIILINKKGNKKDEKEV